MNPNRARLFDWQTQGTPYVPLLFLHGDVHLTTSPRVSSDRPYVCAGAVTAEVITMSLSRRLLPVFLLITCILPLALAPVGAQEASELQINSSRYIVIDATTGHVYAQRGATDQVAIASITKVFTAVQALEMASLETPITTKDSDLRRPDGPYFGADGSLMGFGVDETYTLEDMLYGLMLPSGNDAALAIARTLGARPGDSDEEAVQHFMDLLNQRIDDMGLADTHLVNPHGWGVEGHYSSASDVAAFNRFVREYPKLMEIMGTQDYTTSNGLMSFRNNNRSLDQFPSVIAGKTGFDNDSGWCLINIAQRGEIEMIAVTLDGIAPGDWYNDNATLLDYGFDRQAALMSSGEVFEGEIATYIDPSIANIERSVTSSTSFIASMAGSGAETIQGNGSVVSAEQPLPVVDASAPQTIAESNLWIAAISVVGLLGMRGLRTFSQHTVRRSHSRLRSSRKPAATVDTAAADS